MTTVAPTTTKTLLRFATAGSVDDGKATFDDRTGDQVADFWHTLYSEKLSGQEQYQGDAFADLGAEENPALGRRGLRLSQARPELLETQLKALAAAASATGNRSPGRTSDAKHSCRWNGTG